MDLFSEATSGTRVLAVRHISADKSLPENNNAVNTTLLCHSYSLQPDFYSYLAVLQPYAWVLWSCELLAILAICILYAVTIRSATKHWRQSITNLTVVLAVYPLVASAAFIAIVVPRARIPAEAVAQQTVMVAMYQLFCMFIAECGGAEHLVRRAGGSRLETRVLPCCCWPCCIIPRPQLQKRKLTWLRYLVLQMPIVQAFIYVLILVLWSENMKLYYRSFVLIQPVIAVSILSGVWGMVMCVRACESAGARPRGRFLAVQLALIIVKLQCAIVKILPEMVKLPCVVALNPTVFVNLIQNSVMILEMLLLSIWAWRLYSVPPGKIPEKIQHVVVAVLDDSACALDVKPVKDGVDNKSFENRGENK